MFTNNDRQEYIARKKELEKLSFTILLSIACNLSIASYDREEIIKEILKTDYEV